MLSAQATDNSTSTVSHSKHDHHRDLNHPREGVQLSKDLVQPGTGAQCSDRRPGADAEALELGRQVQRKFQLMDDDEKLANQVQGLQGQHEQAQAVLLSLRSQANEISTSCTSLDSEIKVLEEQLVKLQSQMKERQQERSRLEQVEDDKRRGDERIGRQITETEKRRLDIRQRICTVKRTLGLDVK